MSQAIGSGTLRREYILNDAVFALECLGIVYYLIIIYRTIFLRIAGKWFMNGLESVEVAKDLELSAITRKGVKRLYANAYPAKE